LKKDGDGGGLKNDGDGGGLKNDDDLGGNVGSCFGSGLGSNIIGGASVSPKVKRVIFSDLFSSSFSDHEKLDGAEDGPGEIASKLGVDFPRE
jgi:hypothetical protein